jgi:hypothetical protein
MRLPRVPANAACAEPARPATKAMAIAMRVADIVAGYRP